MSWETAEGKGGWMEQGCARVGGLAEKPGQGSDPCSSLPKAKVAGEAPSSHGFLSGILNTSFTGILQAVRNVWGLCPLQEVWSPPRGPDCDVGCGS